MRLNLPVYNRAGVRELARLAPFLRPHDTLMLVSGNGGNPLDLGWLEGSVAYLADAYGGTQVLLATAGLEHLGRLAGAGLPARGLVYIYEPDFPNVPEFSWEAARTLANLERAAQITRAAGFESAFKPTGRPLFQSELFEYGWDYGAFAAPLDALLVQTQTYCRRGDFAGAADKLASACRAQLAKTWVQVTVDPAAPNGVQPGAAAACLEVAQGRGFAGATLWWAPPAVAEVVTTLATFRD